MQRRCARCIHNHSDAELCPLCGCVDFRPDSDLIERQLSPYLDKLLPPRDEDPSALISPAVAALTLRGLAHYEEVNRGRRDANGEAIGAMVVRSHQPGKVYLSLCPLTLVKPLAHVYGDSLNVLNALANVAQQDSKKFMTANRQLGVDEDAAVIGWFFATHREAILEHQCDGQTFADHISAVIAVDVDGRHYIIHSMTKLGDDAYVCTVVAEAAYRRTMKDDPDAGGGPLDIIRDGLPEAAEALRALVHVTTQEQMLDALRSNGK